MILPHIPAGEEPSGSAYLFPWQLRNVFFGENGGDTGFFDLAIDSGGNLLSQNFDGFDPLPYTAPRFMLPYGIWENEFTAAIGLFLLPMAVSRYIREYREFLRDTRVLRARNPLLWHQILHGSENRNQALDDRWETQQRELRERREDVMNPWR